MRPRTFKDPAYVAFGDLEPGDHFSFLYGWPPREGRDAHSASVHIRMAGKRYKNADGQVFSASRLSAVIRRTPIGDQP